MGQVLGLAVVLMVFGGTGVGAEGSPSTAEPLKSFNIGGILSDNASDIHFKNTIKVSDK